MAAGNFAQELREELTCPVCLGCFTDPVSTVCEHNFCRACLTRSWEAQEGNAFCPLCRDPAQKSRVTPNLQLADAVQISMQFSLQMAEGTGGVCESHQEPLKLFCRDHKAPICVVCSQSEEHREHRVIPMEEAAEDCKGKIQALLEKKTQMLAEQEKAEEQRNQVELKQLQDKKQEITSALGEMRRYLQEKERYWWRQLAGLEEEIKSRLEENVRRLSKETSHFCNLIKDMELQSQKPPNEFLQHLGNILNRCLKWKMTEKLIPSPGLEWKFLSNHSKISVLKNNINVLEGSMMQALNEVSVTLDPDTAHPELILSEDLKSVRCGNINQSLPDNPERFDAMACVLGRERFTSGRHYWEVEVEKLDEEEIWAVGVALESLTRKGWVYFCPPKGVWVVGKESLLFHKLLAYTCLRAAPVTLTEEPKKILVYLDYEEGRVEFFNADTEVLLFTFPPASFGGEGVRPFFMVGSGVGLNC